MTEEFYNHALLVVAALQIHAHTETCQKGKIGETMCRVSRAMPLADAAAILALFNDKESSCGVRAEPAAPKHPADYAARPQACPLPQPPRQNIYYQHPRPLIETVPPAAEDDNGVQRARAWAFSITPATYA